MTLQQIPLSASDAEGSPAVSPEAYEAADKLITALWNSREQRQRFFRSPIRKQWESFQNSPASNILIASALGIAFALPLTLLAYYGATAAFSLGALAGQMAWPLTGLGAVGSAVASYFIHKSTSRTLQQRFQAEQDAHRQAKDTWDRNHRTLRRHFFPDFGNELIDDLIKAKADIHQSHTEIETAAQERKNSMLQILVTGGGGLAVLGLQLAGLLANFPGLNALVHSTFSSVLFYGTMAALSIANAGSFHLANKRRQVAREMLSLDDRDYTHQLKRALALQYEKTAQREKTAALARQAGQDPVKRPLLASLFQVLAQRSSDPKPATRPVLLERLVQTLTLHQEKRTAIQEKGPAAASRQNRTHFKDSPGF